MILAHVEAVKSIKNVAVQFRKGHTFGTRLAVCQKCDYN
jgi:hypothetical protein